MNQNPFGGQDPFEYLRRQMEEQLRQKQQKNQWQKQQSGGANQNRQNGSAGGSKNEEPERFDSDGNPIKNKKKKLRLFRNTGVAVAVVALAMIGINSYYVLDEENYAVVTTLGSPQAESQAGLHFKIPFIQNVTMVSKGIKGMPIGYIPESGESVDEESIMITKDFNFVNTDFYLEYMVNDPVKYLYASSDPEATLKMLAQSYIRDTVGIYNVDDVITTGKAVIQSEIKEKLTNRMIAEDIVSYLKEIEEELQSRYELLAKGIESDPAEADYMLLIIDNPDAIEQISNSKEALASYKNIIGRYRNMNVGVIISAIENAPIPYSAPEVIKGIRDGRHLMYFGDISELKIYDMPLAVTRKFKKPIETGDGYYIKENECIKLKTPFIAGE